MPVNLVIFHIPIVLASEQGVITMTPLGKLMEFQCFWSIKLYFRSVA